ncbi:hypothetical protein ACFSM5_07800 [Lacibacterium aquatile]|uniref:Uncharacterized protein n=1 Tax=Lacibacterium aquatile TaxID=1168082 RepID=A0ABW5DQG2_9PROT
MLEPLVDPLEERPPQENDVSADAQMRRPVTFGRQKAAKRAHRATDKLGCFWSVQLCQIVEKLRIQGA